LSRAARRGLRLAAAALGCAGIWVAVSLSKGALAERVAARVARELASELRSPRLELAPGRGGLRLVADLSSRRAGASLDAPRSAVLVPLSALLGASRLSESLRVELSGAALALSPRAPGGSGPPLPGLRLRDLSGFVERAPGEPGYSLELAGELASGGALALAGDIGAGAEPAALHLDLRAAQLAALLPAVAALEEFEGRASGACRLGLEGSAPRELACQLSVEGARLRIRELLAEGPLELELALAFARGAARSESLRGLSGHFQIDAGAARLSFSGLSREAGQPATIRGQVLPGPGGPRLEYQLRFEQFELKPQGDRAQM